MRKITLLILLVFGLLISGCSSNGDSRTSGFLGGGSGSSSSSGSSNGGVDLAFNDAVDNIQPQKGEPFSLVLDLINNQEHEISSMEIRVSGFDKGYLTSGDLDRTEDLGMAREGNPYQKTIIYENIELDGFIGDYEWNPIFKYCYDSTTKFREQICVPNRLGQSCENDVDSNTFSNGPLGVEIENIYPIGEDEIGMDLIIKNRESGEIVTECFEDKNLKPFGKLDSEPEVRLGSDSGDCQSITSEDYTVNNDELKMRCTFSRNSQDAYTSQITVTFDYRYQEELERDIVIKDLEQFR